MTFLHIYMPDIPGHVRCEASTRLLIDYVQNPECPAVTLLLMHEVIAPHMVWVFEGNLRHEPSFASNRSFRHCSA